MGGVGGGLFCFALGWVGLDWLVGWFCLFVFSPRNIGRRGKGRGGLVSIWHLNIAIVVDLKRESYG